MGCCPLRSFLFFTDEMNRLLDRLTDRINEDNHVMHLKVCTASMPPGNAQDSIAACAPLGGWTAPAFPAPDTHRRACSSSASIIASSLHLLSSCLAASRAHICRTSSALACPDRICSFTSPGMSGYATARLAAAEALLSTTALLLAALEPLGGGRSSSYARRIAAAAEASASARLRPLASVTRCTSIP